MGNILVKDQIIRLAGKASLGIFGLMMLIVISPTMLGSAKAIDLATGQSMASNTTQARILVQSAISLAMQNSIDVDVVPRTDGSFSSASSKMHIATNNSTGYGVYMGTMDGSQTLNLVNDSATTIAPLTVAVDENNFPNNTWGYKLIGQNVANSADDLLYHAVPGATTTQVRNTAIRDEISQQDTYELSFGTKVDTTVRAGLYQNQVVVSVVANPRALESFGEITFMQDMTQTICQSMKDLPANQQTGQLIDQRDGKSYWVSYLADGNCWMTQNLALDLTKDEVLTPADSDVTSDWTVPTTTESEVSAVGGEDLTGTRSWNLGEYVLATPTRGVLCSSGTGDASVRYGQTIDRCSDFQRVDDTWTYKSAESGNWNGYNGLVAANVTNKTYDSHYLIGNYYQWNTAVAGSGGTAVNVDAIDSICPKGWQLPSTSQYTTIATGYQIGDNTVGANIFSSTPLSFVRSGFMHVPYCALYGAGVDGYYWSSSAYSSVTYAYALHFTATTVSTAFRDSARYLGLPIRCLAR